MAMSIVTLAQASRGYISRMLRNGVLMLLVAICLCAVGAHAQDATWLLSPGSGDWSTAANWAPPTVPTGTATFGPSSTTSITFFSLSTPQLSHIVVHTLQFNAGAPAYSFNISVLFGVTEMVEIKGAGIVNNSSNRPTFLVDHQFLQFLSQSTAGNAAIITSKNGPGGGVTQFLEKSTAGTAAITNNGGTTEFSGTSTAGTAVITNNIGGSTQFFGTSTADTATITNNGGGVTQFFNTSTGGNAHITTLNGGVTQFFNTSTAGTATITTNNGGITEFLDTSTAGAATITTINGGVTQFFNTSTGGQARFRGTGVFDISGLASGGMTAGSIEGAGAYRLGSKALTVGQNNLSTQVSGTIQDGGGMGGTGGALIKVGMGTLTLTGLNSIATFSYSGGTSFNGGILAVNGDANLGTGPLSFNGGTLEALAAGGGITSTKAVTLNTSGGTFLADAGASSALSGAISGVGSFTKAESNFAQRAQLGHEFGQLESTQLGTN